MPEQAGITIPTHIRSAAGVPPGSPVELRLEAAKIVVGKMASGAKTERREQLRTAAAQVRNSRPAPFRQTGADEIMAFPRTDGDPGTNSNT